MSKRDTRQIPKALADFGERQFQEMGPDSVEVLRVKASTIRKYWSKLQGISYLVSVISSDRVRIYFFNSSAIMLVGENIDHDQYVKIREKSKLIKKYERPKPPTELELRMEATEEMRSALAKALRRVARFLGVKEPAFPNIYVSKILDLQSSQSFGLRIADDGSFLFLESSATPSNLEALSIRSSFLALLDKDRAGDEFAECISNAITSILLKDKPQEIWVKWWLESSKGTDFQGVVNHLLVHRESYGAQGMFRILQLLRKAPTDVPIQKWKESLEIIHNYHEVSVGTEAWPIVNGFCKSLEKPRNLLKSRHSLKSIHLAPRALCNTMPIGKIPRIHKSQEFDNKKEVWLSVSFLADSGTSSLFLNPTEGDELKSIHYDLRLDDIFPKVGGILSTGKDILRWALQKLSITDNDQEAFSTSIHLKEASLSEAEKAVLERLSLGDTSILANTLVGSPQRIESLMNSGCLKLIPSFGHLGIEPEYLVSGTLKDITNYVIPNVLEATTFETDNESISIVAAPSMWYRRLIDYIEHTDLKLNSLTRIASPRNLIRKENVFPNSLPNS